MPDNTMDALADAETFELLSLEPTDGISYRGYRVIGQTRITDPAVRRELIEAVLKGIQQSEHSGKCFSPRHGIRIIRYGHIAEYVICFHCSKAAIFIDGEQVAGFLTSDSPKATFNEVLRGAGVPLAAD